MDTPKTRLARTSATCLHSGHFRSNGIMPYINHCRGVVERLVNRYQNKWSPRDLEIGIQIAWLHDTIEDKRCTMPDLISAGFDPEVLVGVTFLTRREGETYGAFILRLEHDEIARGVKICDILDNLGDAPTNNAIRRYAQALLVLLAHEGQQNAERDREETAGA